MYDRKYKKKYPFEKSQYHQCMPNPKKENEFITVQWVNRCLTAEKENEAGTDNHKLKYKKYELVAINAE